MGLRLRTVIAAAAVAAAASPAMATLVTVDGGYAGPIIDLSSRASLLTSVNGGGAYTTEEIALPGMKFIPDGKPEGTNLGFGAVLGSGAYLLGDNGGLDTRPVYAGLNGPGGYMDFRLTGGAVSEFGAYVNYSTETVVFNERADTNPYIAALDSAGVELERWDLAFWAPVNTLNELNVFEFRGIQLNDPIITTLRFGNAFIFATASADGSIRTFIPYQGSVPVPAVPEPQTYALMLAGLGAVAFMVRRRRTQPS